MKKIYQSIAACMLAAMLVFSALVPAAAAKKNTSNRFNVCFVLDSTDSLRGTDPEKLRFDATSMFMGLLADSGNKVGSVIFSGGIMKQTDIVPITGAESKKKAEADLETKEKVGGTTICAALNAAADMLISKGDPSLPSVIILMSDGTDTSEAERIARDDAMDKCVRNNIPVYSVALNADGSADIAGMERIANGTKGKFKAVSNANDLKDVFKDFYQMIYSTGVTHLIDGKIPDDGVIEEKFDVPSQGVEEINIIITSETKLQNLTLKEPEPNGRLIPTEEVEMMTTDAKQFSITKITKPMGGEWLLRGEGKPGADIKIDMVYNDTLTVETEYDKKDLYGVNDTVTVSGYIVNDGNRMTTGYEDYTAKLVPDSSIGREFPMQLENNRFVGQVTFDGEGTYAYHMEIDGNGINKATDQSEILLNVGNQPPVITEEGKDLSKHFWVFPFFTKTCEVELSEAAKDPDGTPLNYSVTFSNYKDTTYSIDGSKLVISDFYDLSKGMCTIKAMDDKNSYVEFDVHISLTNVGILTLIIIGVGGLLFIAAVILLLRWRSLIKFMGSITVTNIETGVSSTQQRSRGQIKLSAFPIGNTGFSPKAHFQATGRAQVEFKSPKPVASNIIVGKSKKIIVRSENSTFIYSDDSKEHGIEVLFESFLTQY